jgi:hypothetical protein
LVPAPTGHIGHMRPSERPFSYYGKCTITDAAGGWPPTRPATPARSNAASRALEINIATPGPADLIQERMVAPAL